MRHEISNNNFHTREQIKAHKKFMRLYYIKILIIQPIGIILFGACLYAIAFIYTETVNSWAW